MTSMKRCLFLLLCLARPCQPQPSSDEGDEGANSCLSDHWDEYSKNLDLIDILDQRLEVLKTKLDVHDGLYTHKCLPGYTRTMPDHPSYCFGIPTTKRMNISDAAALCRTQHASLPTIENDKMKLALQTFLESVGGAVKRLHPLMNLLHLCSISPIKATVRWKSGSSPSTSGHFTYPEPFAIPWLAQKAAYYRDWIVMLAN
ncbi:hypothetical protein CAPTEDRAFT_214285 [Capitella teleta]|uniref:C-type lectin domain-containing protein n=1 Tax=Capitella teleta TaxID=283909 RepID=R7V211_CAPTE|nr:hypothetical protein CAPTEDRAFT_214285 [Capitella teleta]|eukprot:ELU10366.1 hypothetical protein CAPTEDRAFT_214285 [Capitella teleta]